MSMYQPLSPTLYNLLVQNFGQVKIANAGCKMVASQPVATLNGRPRREVLSSGEYYRVCCPFCRDTRYRLWVNHAYGQLESNGQYRNTWLAHCYNDEKCLDDTDNRYSLADRILGFKNSQERKQLVMPIAQGTMELAELRPHEPPGTLFRYGDLPVNHEARTYLGGRGFSTQMLDDQYCVMFCTYAPRQYHEAQGRIIVPVYMDGVCVGWQGRLPFDAPKTWYKDNRPKYYTCPSMARSQLLYNWDIARHYPFLVIEEGVTDVWATGPFAVSTLGASLSWPQKSLLMFAQAGKPLVFIWDPEAWLEMEGTMMDLRRARSNQIVEVHLPADTDPGQYTQDAMLRIIYGQASQQGVRLPEVRIVS